MGSVRPEPDAQGSRGLLGELLNLFSSIGRHFQAIGALAGEEAREAAVIYLKLLGFLAGGLFFLAFGYILALFFIAFLAATVFGISWIWIVLSLAVLHFLLAAVCAIYIRTHWMTPIFRETRNEIARDFEALRSKRP